MHFCYLVLLLFFLPLTEHHGQWELLEHRFGLMVPERVSIMVGSVGGHAQQQAARTRAELSHLNCIQETHTRGGRVGEGETGSDILHLTRLLS